MRQLNGIAANAGIAAGPLQWFGRCGEPDAVPNAACEPAQEWARYEAAKSRAAEQLETLQTETGKRLGEENAALFEVHRMMLDDFDYNDAVQSGIQLDHLSAEAAVERAGKTFETMFAEMQDPYLRARAADVADVSARLIRILSGKGEAVFAPGAPCILAAADLLPSETARLDARFVRAILTAAGTATSHTAIFARTLGIPAVVGLGDALLEIQNETEVAVDAGTGTVYVAPDAETKAALVSAGEKIQQTQALDCAYFGKATVTASGRRITLCANIGSPDDLAAVQAADAEGIGLFRSEFLYLNVTSAPDEETQYLAYRKALEAMGARPVVVRLLDIGADKQVPYLQLPVEDNPALGMRAIRLLLTQRELLTTQLRALARASSAGNLSVMIPMVTARWEIDAVRTALHEVFGALDAEGVPHAAQIPVGIMIETPAAAILSDELSKAADFFSIGTNDLTQYTLACDRQNAAANAFCGPYSEAMFRLIEMAVKNARAANIWCGVCGELAADPAALPRLVAAGVDELSVAPAALLRTRRFIAEQCK